MKSPVSACNFDGANPRVDVAKSVGYIQSMRLYTTRPLYACTKMLLWYSKSNSENIPTVSLGAYSRKRTRIEVRILAVFPPGLSARVCKGV